MSSQAAQFVVNVQILRAVAALLVVMVHAVDLAIIHAGEGFTLGAPLDNFGAVGVDLFFVISGYIIAHTGFVGIRRDARSFAIQRLRRVVPLYFLLSTPWIVMAAFTGPVDGGQVVATLLFWPASSLTSMSMLYMIVGWTLCFEMLFYAAATLALLRPGQAMVGNLLLAYAACWALRQTTGLAPFRFLGNPIIVEFLLGVLIAHAAVRLPRRLGPPALVAGIIGLAATLVFGYGTVPDAYLVMDSSSSLHRLLIWGLPSAAVVLGAVLMPRWQPDAVMAPLVALGAASYSLYLAHGLAMRTLEEVLAGFGQHWDGFAVFAAGIAVSVAAGLLVHRHIERRLLAPARRADAGLAAIR